jgi:hypothetical protein
VLGLWAQVLTAVPDSRLLLLCQPGDHRQGVLDRLAAGGVGAGRVEFAAFRPRPEYLALHQRVDLGLDTFPYNGHTTSLDAFWMGVPVVTRLGDTVVGRAGWSQLPSCGPPWTWPGTCPAWPSCGPACAPAWRPPPSWMAPGSPGAWKPHSGRCGDTGV